MSPKQGFFNSLNNIVLYKYLIHRYLLLTIVFSDIFTSSYPTFTPSHFVQRNVGSIYVAVIASGYPLPAFLWSKKHGTVLALIAAMARLRLTPAVPATLADFG